MNNWQDDNSDGQDLSIAPSRTKNPDNSDKQETPAANARMSDIIHPASDIWEKVQARLVKVLGERVHLSWTGQLKLQSEDDSIVILSVPSKFVANRIDDRYGDLLRNFWAEYDPRRVNIEMAKPQTKARAQAKYEYSKKQNRFGTYAKTGISSESAKNCSNDINNKHRFSFDNFVVGPSNELAFAVARRIASSSESQYNPVVIYGPHGMGKTHLLHAIKNETKNTNPGRRVRLVSSEEFVASFVGSVRAKGRSQINAFKSGLRDVDLLLIDDAHFIAAKPGSGEELMHTLINMVEAGKQVLLAADRHPHEIIGASERLKSYLCGGLLCDIGPADYELRRRILDRLIERRRQSGNPSLAIPQDARDHLAARINATPRDLEGAFNQIVARLEFLGRPLTLDSIQEALAHARYAGQVRPTVDKIQKATIAQFGISMDDLLSKRRARTIARPRQIAMYVCKKLTTRSLPDIGRRFGGRDHTTVIHAVKKIEELRASDPAINSQVETLISSLKTLS